VNPYSLLKPRPAPARSTKRMYGAASWSRLTADWAPMSSSADAEIVTSLRVLRNRSRQLVRDNEYAKNGVRQIVQNVIGTGIRMEPTVKNQRGTLVADLNEDIRDAFNDWWHEAGSVHTAGLMNGHDIERYLIHNLVESGEAIVRIVRKPFGDSSIPLALELIESDRLMDQWTQRTAPNGNVIRMGVEMDQWHRPTAYWCWPVHPGDFEFATFSPSAFIRVPAEDIIHLYIIDRWPQSRGIPWFHAAMKRLNNMGGYEEAEIIAARGSAAIMGFIESPDVPTPDDVEDGKRVDDMEPGQVRHLLPGEKFTGFNPSRPNAQVDPFIRLMLRGVAAAIGISYETLSRDYSNTNYSSARAAVLEDRDLFRVLQHWFIGRFRQRIHREFMQAAVLANQLSIPDFLVNEKKYMRVHFKPRGWTWIDPQKEVSSYTAAVRSGFMTVTDVVEQTNNGRDAADVFKARRQELDAMAELDLVFDTDPAQVNQKGIAQPETAPEEEVGKPAEPGEDAEQGSASGDEKPAQGGASSGAKPQQSTSKPAQPPAKSK
jgi:lambda family phage portal protein